MTLNRFNVPEEHKEFLLESFRYNNYDKIKICSDWHLFRNKKGELFENPKSVELINNQIANVKPTDTFLYLGDLCDDGTHEYKEQMREILLSLNGKHKILVLGNNDEYDEEFYKSCGFDYVCHFCKLDNILFSHSAVLDNIFDINVHGHNHGGAQYIEGVYPDKCIDVYYVDSEKPVSLAKILKFKDSGKYKYNKQPYLDEVGYTQHLNVDLDILDLSKLL